MNIALHRFLVAILFVSLLSAWGASSLYAQKKMGIKTVVIDAGHGGKDPGACFKQYQEKDINLSVALLLGDLITKNLPDVKVVYTRKTDVFIELNERGNIANKASADLFISIHVNSSTSVTPSGSSTYVMGNSKSAANLAVAMRENDVVSFEEDFSTKYEGYIPGSTESYIIFSLMQYAYQDQSMNFAGIVQKNYKLNTSIPDRGTHQAPYLVLWRTAMPSVLTELGFLPNDKDRAYMISNSGQKSIARALFNAFSEYKSKVEGSTKIITLAAEQSEDTSEDKPDTGQTSTSGPAATSATETSTSTSAESGIIFCVQICSSPTKVPSSNATLKPFAGQYVERKVGSLYKYFVGETASYDEALRAQANVRRNIKDAFVVAFRDGKPIPVTEARKLTGK